MRRALAIAAGLTATLGLAQPALAGTARPTNTQSTVLAGYNFRRLYRGTGGRERRHCRAQAHLQGHATGGPLDLRRRRHPIGQLVRPSVPGLHAARRGPLLPIARGQWHYQEHSRAMRPTLETRSSSRFPERLSNDGLGDRHDAQVRRHPQRHRQRHRRGHHGRRLSSGFRLDDVWGASLAPWPSPHADQWIPVRLPGNWTPGRRPVRELVGPLQIKTTSYSASNKGAFATVFRHS